MGFILVSEIEVREDLTCVVKPVVVQIGVRGEGLGSSSRVVSFSVLYAW